MPNGVPSQVQPPVQAPAQSTALGLPFTGIAEPGPNQLLSQISKPAQTPEEVIERKGLWQSLIEKINTDPNLRNAMLTVGTHLLQPPNPGQSPAGQVGQAIGAGFGTFKAGEFSQFQQEQQAAEAARKERESAAGIGKTKANTAAITQATNLARQLEGSQIARAELELEGLRTRLKTAGSEAEVKAVEAELAKRRGDIEKTIPDTSLRASRLAELDKVSADVAEARSRSKNLEAAAGHFRARTAAEQQQVDVINKLSDKEKLEFFSKSGKFASTALSSVVQQGEFWGRIYDALPAEDTDKKGKTREQYMAFKLKQATERSQIETLTKALQNVGDPDLQQQIEEMIKLEVQRMRQRSSGTPSPAAGATSKEKSTLLPGGKFRRVEIGPGRFRIESVEGPGFTGSASSGGPQP